jgi:hypothetical protein
LEAVSSEIKELEKAMRGLEKEKVDQKCEFKRLMETSMTE